MKNLKKTLFVTIVLALIMTVIFGKDAWNYFRTATGVVRYEVDERIPIGFQIKRLDLLIAELDRHLHKKIHNYSAQEIRLEKIMDEEKKNGPRTRESQSNLKEKVLQLTTQIEGANEGQDQTNEKRQLALLWRTYQINENARQARLNAIAIGKDAIAASREEMQLLRSEQNLILAERTMLANRADLAQAEDWPGAASFETQESSIKRITALIKTLNDKMDVGERTVHNTALFSPGTATPHHADTDSLLQEIKAHFENNH